MAIEPVYREVCIYNDRGYLLGRSIAPFTPTESERVLFFGHRYMRPIYPTEIILPTLPVSVHKLRLWKRPDSSTLFWFLHAPIREAYAAGKTELFFSISHLDAYGEPIHPGDRQDRGEFVYVQHDQVHVGKNDNNHVICTWDIDIRRPVRRNKN